VHAGRLGKRVLLDVGDVNGDGAVDIVVGNFSFDRKMSGLIDVSINQGREGSLPKGGAAR